MSWTVKLDSLIKFQHDCPAQHVCMLVLPDVDIMKYAYAHMIRHTLFSKCVRRLSDPHACSDVLRCQG